MKYNQVIHGIFVRRENRFIAYVLLEGIKHTVHVKNTGRCLELLLPGVEVVLEVSAKSARKTRYSLIAVMKNGRLINIDSQAPNQVVHEALAAGSIREITSLSHLKREVTFGHSRFDLAFETEAGLAYMEVKGVTLESDGVVMFPDAPTQRGTKHVRELAEAVRQGCGGWLLFLIQMEAADYFRPHEEMDPEFAGALRLAAAQGVQVLAYTAMVAPDELVIGHPVEVRL